MNYLSEQFTSYDRYLALEAFSEGRSFEAWKLFGAHPDTQDGETGYRFLLWAPHAKKVCLTGDFNKWNDNSHPMVSMEGGIWELFIPRLNQYDAYKYAVHSHSGSVVLKADPYGFHSETRPETATKLYPMGQYQWNDSGWQKYLEHYDPYNSPLNVYELHLGSWRRDGEGRFLDYRSIASLLVPYVKEMGYTHVELMPVMEHPLDDSWGYQVTGYFAATSRFGTPDDLKYLIDQLHVAGIGVILDWVPAHFPRDAFGLYQFDGTPTYEYEDPRKGEHPQWGTNCFDLGRNEVKSFLFSSAMFWLEEYHADGLRVDAVSSMLYLNFGREDSPWMPNVDGGQENLEAIDFLRELNSEIFIRRPKTLMVAEEATSWPQVTHPVSDGGLGFNFKWNMGWMNDICHYIELDPLARQHHHKDLTFAMMYAFNENYILPMSHDEVVHEKSSYLGKMAGDTFQKLSSSRAFQLYVITHPGKKLTFMGAEIGQWNEWNFEHSMDWHLMEFDDHKKINYFHKKANELYLSSPSLWQRDTSWDGFLWLCADDNLGNTLAYARWDNEGNPLAVVCNFSPVHRHGYRLPLPKSGIWEEAFNTDWVEFGGANHRNDGLLYTQDVSCYGQSQSMEINLPPNATVVFSYSKKNVIEPVELFDSTIHENPNLKSEDQDFSSDESSRWEMAEEEPQTSTSIHSSLDIIGTLGLGVEFPDKELREIAQEKISGRNKKSGSNLTIGEETTEEPEETLKPRRTRKKKTEEPVAEEVSEPSEAEVVSKPRRTRKKKAEETVAETSEAVAEISETVDVTPKPRRTRKKKEEVEEATASEETTTKEVTPEPPKRRGRPKKVVDDGAIKPKRRGRPKKSDPEE